MPTIIDSLLLQLGIDNSDMKKGAAEAGRIEKKLEDDHKKFNKKLSDDDKKRAEEQKKQNKQATEQSRAIADGIRKVRNETIGLLGLFMGGMGAKNFIANTVDQAASLKFLSENLDTSVESIQAYQRASERMGGTAAGAVAQMQESQRELSRLKTGQGPSEAMQATFRAAGMAGEAISQKDLSTGNDYLMARSRIIATLYKQNASNAALMASQMGISEEQFNLIKQGPAAIQALVDAQRKNSMMTTADVVALQKLKSTWLDFTDSMQATGTKMLVSLIPAFKEVIKWLQGIADYIAAHREDIAKWIEKTIPKVLALADKFGEFLKNTNWDGAIGAAKVLLDIVTDIANAVKSVGEFLGESAAKTVTGAENLGEKSASVIKNMSSFFGVGAGTVAQNSTSTDSSKTDVKIGQITVQTQATDAAGVAKALWGELNRFAFTTHVNPGMR